MPDNFFKSITNTQTESTHEEPKKEQVDALKSLIGLTLTTVEETLIDDLDQLIKRKIVNGLDGYIHCLSRLMRHEVVWEIVIKAYLKNGAKPPTKYAALLGRVPAANAPSRPTPNWIVK